MTRARTHTHLCVDTHGYAYGNVAQSLFNSNFPSSKPINAAYLHVTRPAYYARAGRSRRRGCGVGTPRRKASGIRFACGDFQRLRFKRPTAVRLRVLDHCRGGPGGGDTNERVHCTYGVRSLFSIVST